MRCCGSVRINRSSRRSSVAASSHCKSSTNSASGCSGRAKTPINRRSTSWETPLRVLWRKLRDRWLVSDDELQLGDDVDHEPCILAERLQQGVAPAAQLGVALAEQRPD